MSRIRAFAGLAAVLALAACQNDASDPLASSERAPKPAVQLSAPDDDVLAREVPGYGGFFFDADGTPTMYLKDAGQRGRAAEVLAPFLRAQGKGLRVKAAQYDFRQLSAWRAKADPMLSLRGVVLTDVDEIRNRVRVGVSSAAAAAQVRAELARRGVPAEAVIVDVTEEFHFAATLRDVVRPIRGGLQIHFSSYLCTLGFNASHSGGNSFVTNSHCTTYQGGTEGTRYYQPSSSLSGQIATEASDPGYWTGGACPAGRRCRYSDAARAVYLSGVSFERGRIARTTSRGTSSGSITISGTTPYFTITAENLNPSAGVQVQKIGRTTGWTYGGIASTCVNVNVGGSDITQLCQDVVNAGVGGGDSGSPVFYWSGSGSNVTLYGILWGGNTSGTQFIFSPLGQVEQELGSLGTIF